MQYKELPIYKATYDMLIRIMQIVKNFSKEYKYTLGEKIEKEAIELVICVYKANQKEGREDAIRILLEKVQLLGLLFRVAHDLKIVSIDQYSQVVEMMNNISRQSQGWLNSICGKSSELIEQ